MKTGIKLVAIGMMALASATQAGNPPASLTMVPAYINYQGRLVTPTNSPYADANHTIDLTLYKSASSSLPSDKLWSERYTVSTKDGYFSVNLGASGLPLLASNNLPIWQVLWRSDAASPDTLFMALTVRTDQNGNNIANPAEATPRQQFLTAPYAFRAHQSVYAAKADGLFDAPQGVQTPAISSTNGEIALNGTVRIPQNNTLFANKLMPQGTTPTSRFYAGGGSMIFGGETSFHPGFGFTLDDAASSISMGMSAGSLYPGTAIYLNGKSVNLNTTNLTVRSQPMFVTKAVGVTVNTSSTLTTIAHGIDVNQYDVFLVGWYSTSATTVRAAYIYPDWTSGYVYYTATPTSGSAYLWFLGIRKGLTDLQ